MKCLGLMGLAHSLKQFSNFVSLSIVHAQHKVRVCTLGNIKLDIMLNDRMRAKFLVSIHLYNSFLTFCVLGNVMEPIRMFSLNVFRPSLDLAQAQFTLQSDPHHSQIRLEIKS